MTPSYSDLLSITEQVLCRSPRFKATPTSVATTERRRSPRYRCHHGVLRILETTDEFITCGQIVDISAGGVLVFALTGSLHEGKAIQVELELPSLPMKLTGTILRVSGEYFAIAFSGLTPNAQRMLDKCLQFDSEFGERQHQMKRVQNESDKCTGRPCGSACFAPDAPCAYLP